MKDEIIIPCYEKDKIKNPHNINEIILKKENNGLHQIILKCKDQKKLENLGSEVIRMCDILDEGDNGNRDYGFSLSYDAPLDCVLLEGDISKAVKALINKGIIRGSIERIFKDDQDEEEIVKFLKESENSNHILSTEENIKDIKDVKNNNHSKKNCTIL